MRWMRILLACAADRFRFRSLVSNTRGASAVEFALMLPVALALYAFLCGLVEAMIVKRDVDTTARTISDLVARSSATGAKANFDCLLGAAAAVMTPWSSANLSVVVTEVQIQAGGSGVVIWSEPAFNGVQRPVGSTVPAPGANSFAQGSYQILAEVSYAYTPFASFTSLTPSFVLAGSQYNSPQVSSSVQDTM